MRPITRAAIAPLALAASALAFGADAGASNKSYMYATGDGGMIEAWPGGGAKFIKGPAICTRNCEDYENFLRIIAAAGVPMMMASAPNTRTGPDAAFLTDDAGNVLDFYGVKGELMRDKSRDKEVATIAGNPVGVDFFAFSSPLLGPDDPSNPMPLSSSFNILFQYSDPTTAPQISDFAGGPYVVISDTVGEQGGVTIPAWTQLPMCSSVMALQSVRNSASAPNPSFFSASSDNGPVVGTSWTPSVRSNSSDISAVDIVLVSAVSTDQTYGSSGRLLVAPPFLFTQSVAHSDAFKIPVPNDCNLIGQVWTAQAATSEPSTGRVTLYNALDVVVGAF